MLPQGDDPPIEMDTCSIDLPTTAPATKPLVKAVTTTLSPLEDVPLTFCSRPPLPFRYPGPSSSGTDHDETIVRMVNDEQSWGDIEALAGEDAFDRYYSFLDPSLEEFWTQDKVEQLNDAVIDQVERFLKPRAATILKGNDRQRHFKDAIVGDDHDREEVKKVATIHPVVVMAAWMDLFRWEKVARSVNSSPLVCQHIWETFGDGRPYSEEEEPVLNEIKAAAIANGTRISAIKQAEARVEASRVREAKQEEARIEVERVKAARIQAIKEEADIIEAARIKATQDEADIIEAERIETERAKATKEEAKRVEAETKRVEAKNARAFKRKTKLEAARAEAMEIKAKTAAAKKKAKTVAAKKLAEMAAAKKDTTVTRVVKESAVKQQAIMQENIATDGSANQEAAEQEAAGGGATRRQATKEAHGEAVVKDRAKREEAALAAAAAWDLTVRRVTARKAEVQAAVIKRQKNAAIAQTGLDQDLPLSSNAGLGGKRKIGSMEIFLPPITLTSPDQDSHQPQQDNDIPQTMHSSISSTSFSSLISPAPSPLDESLDFHLSKRSRLRSSPESLCSLAITPTEVTTAATPTTSTVGTPRPASLPSGNHSSTPKAFPLSHPPTSLLKDTESLKRIRKLNEMKQVLADRVQAMELQCQLQKVETDKLLRHRDEAIEAAKDRQRGNSDTTVHYSDYNSLPRVQSEDPSRTSQEATPPQTGLPSPITPTQFSVSLPTQPSTAQPAAAPPVIDLTDDPDPPPQDFSTSTLHQHPLPDKDYRPQQHIQSEDYQQQLLLRQQQQLQQLQQMSSHQMQLAQKNYQQLQNLARQYLLHNQQAPFSHQPQPPKALQRPPIPHGKPLELVATPTQQALAQQRQDSIQQILHKSPELQQLRQQHLLEKHQLLQRQQQERQQLAQDQLQLSPHLHTNQQSAKQHLRTQAMNQIQQRAHGWKKRDEELLQQERVLSPKLAGYCQHIKNLRLSITSEQKKSQSTVTPEHIRLLHADQQIKLLTSQGQRYKEIHHVPVELQAMARARLNQVCRVETQTLLEKQKDEEGTMRQHVARQEAAKQSVLSLQRQLHQAENQEKKARKQLQDLHTQKLEHRRLGQTLLRGHEALRQQLLKDFQTQHIVLPMEGTEVPQIQGQQGQQNVLSELSQRQYQEREVLRQTQLRQQIELQQTQSRAVKQQEQVLFALHTQGRPQAITQSQAMALAQAQVLVQAQHRVRMDSLTSTVSPNSSVPPILGLVTSPASLLPQAVSVARPPVVVVQQLAPPIQHPLQPHLHFQPQLQALVLPTAAKMHTSVFGRTSPLGLAALSPSVPQEEQAQQQQEQERQPSQESSSSEFQSATFPFPNPLYDITEWTARDRDRLWTTWLEVGDDWEQISTKGLQGKFSAAVCCAVILGTEA
ncbi:hypothetical protein BGX24_012523 [Mortierella sp. AD032]|nr:hypothetical protein BGX24_012523 [Mortierella sp. AD032]